MAIPIAQATVSGFHTIELPTNVLSPTFTIPLTGSATGGPTLEWEWNIAASGEYHRGGAPYGSLVASGVKGSFTNGVAKTQNPSAILDTPGGYTFSLRTRNIDGWSDPSYLGDGWRCQTNTYILTAAGIKLPAPNEYNYEYDLHNTVNALASGLGGKAITVSPTVSGQVPTWNPAQNEYKPQVPFTNELLGKSLANTHPTAAGQVLAWTGSAWAPMTITSTALTASATPSTNPIAINQLAYTNIAGLSFSITTRNTNESVQLIFKGTGYAGAGTTNAYIQWTIDGVAVAAPSASLVIVNATTEDISSSFTTLITTPGSHTITVQGKYLTATWSLYDCFVNVVQFLPTMIAV